MTQLRDALKGNDVLFAIYIIFVAWALYVGTCLNDSGRQSVADRPAAERCQCCGRPLPATRPGETERP